ncbi:MAG: hypothetical protein ACPGZP_10545, partial [Panacagrimonas sp.]
TEVLAVLDGADAFRALESDLRALRSVVETGDSKESVEQVQAVERAFRAVDGGDDVKKALGKARRGACLI